MKNDKQDLLLIEFYKDCFEKSFTDINDEYQFFKINTIAKKHKVIGEKEEITKDLFEEAKQLTIAEEQKKLKKTADELEKKAQSLEVQTNKELYLKNKSLTALGGKEKRLYQINREIQSLKERVNEIESRKKSAIESVYRGNKTSRESWFWNGLGAELATGSRVVGSLAVGETNAKNLEIDAKNAALKAKIMMAAENNPSFSTANERRKIKRLENKLEEYEMAFVSQNKNYFKNVSYNNLKCNFGKHDNSITVSADMWLKEKPEMPNAIDASLDGTCEAVFYNKETFEPLESVLIPLPYMGLGNDGKENVSGIAYTTVLNDSAFERGDYDVVLIDHNICAIEEKASSIYPDPGIEKPRIQDMFFYEALKKKSSTCDIPTLRNIISTIEDIDTNIEGKKEFVNELKSRLTKLEEEKTANEKREKEKKAEAERKAVELKQRSKKIAPFVIAAVLVLLVLIGVYQTIIVPNNKYKKAETYINEGDYDDALSLLEGMGDSNKKTELINNAKYLKAEQLSNEGDYENAFYLYSELKKVDYKDSSDLYIKTEYAYLIKEIDNSLSTKNCNKSIEFIKKIVDSDLPESYKNIDDYVEKTATNVVDNKEYALFYDLYDLLSDKNLVVKKESLKKLALITSFADSRYNQTPVSLDNMRNAADSLPVLSSSELRTLFPGKIIQYRDYENKGGLMNFKDNGTAEGSLNTFVGSTVSRPNWYISGNKLYISNPATMSNSISEYELRKLDDYQYIVTYYYDNKLQIKAFLSLYEINSEGVEKIKDYYN